MMFDEFLLETNGGDLTLEDLLVETPATLDTLPVSMLSRLQADAQSHLAQASKIVAILHGVFTRRYAQGLNGTGTHRRIDGDYEIRIEVPKTVAWDQAKLAAAIETIRSWGEDPADYVETKLSVSETSYKAWPPAIRDLFTPARTVKPGKTKFMFTLGQEEEEA
ncbi:hypothetical protein [Novosphingobium sp.]|uniref:hypothetical protein n=1 Tax=Novosphingobium sp. TaxID=1874826 RepID=UPI0035B246B5